jgi:hypothetical protein
MLEHDLAATSYARSALPIPCSACVDRSTEACHFSLSNSFKHIPAKPQASHPDSPNGHNPRALIAQLADGRAR